MTVAAAIACQSCGATDTEVAWSAQLGRDVCLTCCGRLTPRPDRWPQDVAVDRFERHWHAQRKREDQRCAALAIDELAACRRIAERARARGHRAMVDPLLVIVVTECDCGHGGDPNWLPLQIVPRWQATMYRCACCGFEQVDARQ